MKTRWLLLIGICLMIVGYYMSRPTVVQVYEVIKDGKGLTTEQLAQAEKTKYVKSFSVHKTEEQVYTVHINGGVRLKNNYGLELKEVQEIKGGYHLIVEEKVKGEPSIHPYQIVFPELQVRIFNDLLKEPLITVETTDGESYRNAKEVKEERRNVHITSGFFVDNNETFANFVATEGDLRQEAMTIRMDAIAKGRVKKLKSNEKYFITYYLDNKSNPWILNIEEMGEGYVKNGVVKKVNKEEREMKINVSGLLTYGNVAYELDEKVVKENKVEALKGKNVFYIFETNGNQEVVRYIWEKK